MPHSHSDYKKQKWCLDVEVRFTRRSLPSQVVDRIASFGCFKPSAVSEDLTQPQSFKTLRTWNTRYSNTLYVFTLNLYYDIVNELLNYIDNKL